MIGRKKLDSQTEFAAQLPAISPEPELPIEDELAAAEASLAAERKRRLMTIIGLALALLGALMFWLATRPPPTEPALTNILSPTPTVLQESELGLRKKIDLLKQEVENANQPSQQLAFPPVEAEIRVDEQN